MLLSPGSDIGTTGMLGGDTLGLGQYGRISYNHRVLPSKPELHQLTSLTSLYYFQITSRLNQHIVVTSGCLEVKRGNLRGERSS